MGQYIYIYMVSYENFSQYFNFELGIFIAVSHIIKTKINKILKYLTLHVI